MKTKLLFLSLLGMFVIFSCYEDKGNYNYKEVNRVELTLSPEGSGLDKDNYILKQPTLDTLYYEITPEVAQSVARDTSNLSYQWIRTYKDWVTNKMIKDTLFTRIGTFKFPPKMTHQYSCLLKVSDKITNTAYYVSFNVKTVVPFLESWQILHGPKGDRQIAAIEYNEGEGKLTTLDISTDMLGENFYGDVDKMQYSPDGGSSNTMERLFLFGETQCYYINPFTFERLGTLKTILPQDSWDSYSFKTSDGSCLLPNGMVVDATGNMYHFGRLGYLYHVNNGGITNPVASNIYVSGENIITIWDNNSKRFMYYESGANYFPYYETQRSDGSYFYAMLTEIPAEQLSLPDNAELIWIGRGIKTMANNGCSALIKEGDNWVMYHIGYGNKNDKSMRGDYGDNEEEENYVQIQTTELGEVDIFSENSCFASSEGYYDQFFYSNGPSLYLYNIITQESSLLYSAGIGSTITGIKYRSRDIFYMIGSGGKGWHRMMGLSVQTASGNGEFHEVVLDNAGDVQSSAIYKGFGEIVDFHFTTIARTL